MPRKALRPSSLALPAQTARPSPWLGYFIAALLAAALTAGGMWLALRPTLHATRTPVATLSGADLVSAGNAAFDRKDWTTATRDYSQAIAQGQDNPDVRTDLGTAYRNLHQPQNALAQYAAAQREDPDHQNSLVNEGIVYAFDLKQTAAAMNVWHQYLRRFPHGEHVADVKRLMTLAASPAPKASPEKP